jgi:hypothetical protein
MTKSKHTWGEMSRKANWKKKDDPSDILDRETLDKEPLIKS